MKAWVIHRIDSFTRQRGEYWLHRPTSVFGPVWSTTLADAHRFTKRRDAKQVLEGLIRREDESLSVQEVQS